MATAAAVKKGKRGQPDTRPYLCLPYWSSSIGSTFRPWDTGQNRPLPNAVISYLCDAIHPSPFTPGQPLEVTVDVRNSGGGNSAAVVVVTVYWADPTVGFAHPHFFAATSVVVPPNRTAPAVVRTPKMKATIPASAPPHVCLVVAVSHPQDRAGTVVDPINDRHWAQRNLQAATAAPGAPALVPFVVANPFASKQFLTLHVRQVGEQHAQRLAHEFRTEPSGVPVSVRLLDANGAALAEGDPQLDAALGEFGPLKTRRFKLHVEPRTTMAPGHSTAVELTLGTRKLVFGSLGVVILAPSG